MQFSANYQLKDKRFYSDKKDGFFDGLKLQLK